jgi:hypothetical protein
MSSERKMPFRFFGRAIVFIASLFILWLGIVIVAGNAGKSFQSIFRQYTNIPVGVAHRGESSLARFRELQTVSDVDIIFIGSSHCYRGFDPRIFKTLGLKTFNMGSTAQTPLNSYYLIRDKLDQLKPKLVIIELYPAMLEGDGAESTLDLLVNLPINKDMIEMSLATKSFMAVNALLLEMLRIHRPPIDSVPIKMPSSDKYVSGGYVERVDPPLSNRIFQSRELSINNRQLGYLAGITRMTRKFNSKVMLVILPIPFELRQSIANYDRIVDKISIFAKAHDVDFIDFNNRMQFDTETDFFDTDHLSQSGVNKFNKMLINILTKNGYIMPSRDMANQGIGQPGPGPQ